MKIIVFDNNSAHWTKKNDDNLKFLQMIGHHCQDLFNSRGYMYLNQIYELFGIKWNPALVNSLYLVGSGPIVFEFEPAGDENILIRIS